MEYQVFIVIAPIAAGLLLLTIGTTWMRRHVPPATSLLVYLSLTALLLVGNSMELILEGTAGTLFFAKLDHLFFTLIPTAWLHFALIYAGREELTRLRRFWIVLVVPVITNVVVQTNDIHGLMWREISYFVEGGFLTMSGSYGPWFWIAGVHNYVLLFAGAVFILRTALGSKGLYQRQAHWLALGALTPLILNLIYVFRLFPDITKDFTPISFALGGVFFFIGIHGNALLRIVPVARNILVEELPTAVVVLDARQRLIDFNRAAAELVGADETHIGRDVHTIARLSTLLSTNPTWEEEAETSFETPGLSSREERHYRVRTRRIPHPREHTRKYTNKSGPPKQPIRFDGYIITMADVTDWVELLDAKSQAVHEVTSANEALQEAQLQLIHREKLASIGHLAAGVAHQVNNPISYVTSNLQTLAQYLQSIPEEESGRREEINDLVADTRTGLQRIGEVVRNLLDFSRAEAGPRLELIDLRECIESTLRIAQQEYRYVAKIERDYEELPMVEGYAGELNQVILAIITNAAQAISAAGLRDAVIRIQTRRSGSSVICRISNSGPPIPQDERARIFEPFYTTKQRGSGTGLGLSIAGDIVMNRHHGSLSLEEAEEREQTTFRIVLPLRQPDGR